MKLKNITKNFGKTRAVDNVSIEIETGEFLTLLGPSGCGKTTILRIIAGLENVTSGQVFLEDDEITHLNPTKRDISIMFQDYALFPHMSISENVSYGLRMRGIRKAERNKQAIDWLETMQLSSVQNRYPSELSGGQRQRVALARSLINKPKVLLLDEPLGALDLKLREQMQFELKSLQRQFEITFVYVTHDQQEAMSMSDRIAIFNEGKIEQIDTPINIYNKPKSAFVADFIGTTSIISKKDALFYFNYSSSFSIRPEFVMVNQSENLDFNITAKISDIQFQGSLYKLLLEKDSILINAYYYPNSSHSINLAIGETINLSWNKSNITDLNE